YCYLVYEDEACVLELLRNSFRTRRIDSDFYRIPLYNFPFRYAKVVPWSIEDTNYCGPTGSSANMQYAIYVGQLHGLMTAKGLANIMDDLFGNVVSATLHTDQYKYPTGSARVIFSSSESYLKAIITQSITIHTSKFTKTIQVHPYLGNTLCNVCLKSPGIYFCRALQCFKYFCLSCWNGFHQNVTENFSEHKPLKR
uniref:RRM domain-containing protein n=1 Tax=Trichobilharzia regenti TaxID=157069 RepID=A0AA85JD10_TRIRE